MNKRDQDKQTFKLLELYKVFTYFYCRIESEKKMTLVKSTLAFISVNIVIFFLSDDVRTECKKKKTTSNGQKKRPKNKNWVNQILYNIIFLLFTWERKYYVQWRCRLCSNNNFWHILFFHSVSFSLFIFSCCRLYEYACCCLYIQYLVYFCWIFLILMEWKNIFRLRKYLRVCFFQ